MKAYMKTILNGLMGWTRQEIKQEIKSSVADFVSFLTVNLVEGSDGFEADKTYTEILEAYNAGYNIQFKIYDIILPLTMYDEDFITITDDINPGTYFIIGIAPDDAVIFESISFEDVIGSMSGASSTSSGSMGLVPQPAAGDEGKYLRGDGTWSDELTTSLNTKMDKENPTGTGSFSMNRKASTTVGSYSHAEGYDTTASGNYSHAEGNNTTASSTNSHAEGMSTTASGLASHAEGSGTKATKNCAHAEGYYTLAQSANSHAEGSGTDARGKSQHVQGEYNIYDPNANTISRGLYAHIVGNGTSTSVRSNAHTLDWEGNAWYSGDVYVGSTSGTNKDEGSKKLATEETVQNLLVETDLITPEDIDAICGTESLEYDTDGNVSVLSMSNYSVMTHDSEGNVNIS